MEYFEVEKSGVSDSRWSLAFTENQHKMITIHFGLNFLNFVWQDLLVLEEQEVSNVTRCRVLLPHLDVCQWASRSPETRPFLPGTPLREFAQRVSYHWKTWLTYFVWCISEFSVQLAIKIEKQSSCLNLLGIIQILIPWSGWGMRFSFSFN